MTDKLGFDLHFVRFLYWTLLDQSSKPVDIQKDHQSVLWDLMLMFLILIMYALAMHFLLAPIDQFYDSRWQSLLAPLSLIPIFSFFNYDVLFMGIHTLLLNAYAAYYVMDPTANEQYT